MYIWVIFPRTWKAFMVLLYVKLVYLGKQEVKTAAGKKTYEKRPLILVTTGQL